MLAVAYELRTEGMTSAEREDYDAWLVSPAAGALPGVAAVPTSPADLAVVPQAATAVLAAPTPAMRATWGRTPEAAAGALALMAGGAPDA